MYSDSRRLKISSVATSASDLASSEQSLPHPLSTSSASEAVSSQLLWVESLAVSHSWVAMRKGPTPANGSWAVNGYGIIHWSIAYICKNDVAAMCVFICVVRLRETMYVDIQRPMEQNNTNSHIASIHIYTFDLDMNSTSTYNINKHSHSNSA